METTTLLAPAHPAQLLHGHQGCFAASLHRSGLHPATKLTQHCLNTQQKGEKHLLGGFGSLFTWRNWVDFHVSQRNISNFLLLVLNSCFCSCTAFSAAFPHSSFPMSCLAARLRRLCISGWIINRSLCLSAFFPPSLLLYWPVALLKPQLFRRQIKPWVVTWTLFLPFCKQTQTLKLWN